MPKEEAAATTTDKVETPVVAKTDATPAAKPAVVDGAKPAVETPVVDDKTAEGEGSSKAGDKAAPAKTDAKVPDKYELTVPKGAEAWIGADDVAMISVIAKAEGWTNEEAQARLEQHVDHLAAQSVAFSDVTRADPEFGGENLAETQRLANAFIARIRPEGHKRAAGFNNLLLKTGYGNHIDIVSFLADAGKLMDEDRPPSSGSATTGAKRSLETVFYGEDKK